MRAVGYLAQNADPDMQASADTAIQAIAQRGDDQVRETVRHDTVPGAAEADWQHWTSDILEVIGELADSLEAGGASEEVVAELRRERRALSEQIGAFREPVDAMAQPDESAS